MKAKYIGISHHKIVKGKLYDVEIEGLVVKTSGDGFNYTFRYSSEENLKEDWLVIES